ncbi:hypothetical protein NPIL_536051 [Nephila pilipes]|uniref:Uncharacterized protein n=1 Tax=Nephila pilipes TaxID=299642 RepID=A0A8X6JRM8_NEPPI|nr:hypothetical protein NPIL_536051 [Nephila pilipes]
MGPILDIRPNEVKEGGVCVITSAATVSQDTTPVEYLLETVSGLTDLVFYPRNIILRINTRNLEKLYEKKLEPVAQPPSPHSLKIVASSVRIATASFSYIHHPGRSSSPKRLRSTKFNKDTITS